ncbi:hypothetical protein SETIT_1G025500v2 [Setaria italica]|uniref:Uncharacterized protein n=1 Tax=Setaria italica TaxID=4555 RepID=A0A368PGZ0_SETIT|nr:hypothetical protein SETIT_1G025500v2 [Setaria italica]
MDGVDNWLVELLKVRPHLLGALRLQVGDVGLDTVKQNEHGTGVVDIPLLVCIKSALIVLESLIGSIDDLLSSISLWLGRRDRGRRTGTLAGDVPPETTGLESDPRYQCPQPVVYPTQLQLDYGFRYLEPRHLPSCTGEFPLPRLQNLGGRIGRSRSRVTGDQGTDGAAASGEWQGGVTAGPGRLGCVCAGLRRRGPRQPPGGGAQLRVAWASLGLRRRLDTKKAVTCDGDS